MYVKVSTLKTADTICCKGSLSLILLDQYDGPHFSFNQDRNNLLLKCDVSGVGFSPFWRDVLCYICITTTIGIIIIIIIIIIITSVLRKLSLVEINFP